MSVKIIIRYFSRLIFLVCILTTAVMVSPAAAQNPAGDTSAGAGLFSPDLLRVSEDSVITGQSADYSAGGDGFPPEFRWAVPAGVGVHAFSVAIDDQDNVYTTDPINHSIWKFTPEGSRLQQWGHAGTGPGEFTAPFGVAVNSSGYIYVTDLDRVQVFGPDGSFERQWGSAGNGTGEFNSVIGIAVNSSGYVYTSESRTNRIQVFDPEGNFLTAWGTAGSGPGEFNGPMSIAVNGSGCLFVADQFNNRVQVFDPSGGFVQSWNKPDGSSGSGEGEFSFPQTITVSGSGSVYVGDAGNRRVQVFDEAGGYVQQFPASVGLGIAVNSSGYVYLTDYSYDRIQVFDPAGADVSAWGARGDGEGKFFHPWGVAVDASGYSFVTDSENHRVQVFSPAGDYAGQWGSQGSGNGQFLLPLGIAVNRSGVVYVADSANNRVQVFTPFGGYLTQWGSYGTGAGQLSDPRGIAVNSSGFVYVTETANARVQIFTGDGVSLGYWGNPGSGAGEFNGPMGIAVNSSGFVFVSENSNNRVQVFDPSGAYVMQIGSYGSGDGMLSSPIGVATDAGGRILVADSGNHRVQVFDLNGVYAGLWGSQGTNPGQFYLPAGIAADSSGNVLVAEWFNDRIQKFAFPQSNMNAPVAVFIANVTSGTAPLAVQFTDLSVPGNTPITNYSWDFGDGSGSVQPNPVHTFTDTGENIVRLTVTDSRFLSASNTSVIVVTSGDTPSELGRDWVLAKEHADFSDRQGHATVVLNDSLMLIAGMNPNGPGGSWIFNNEVWKTDDGITWTPVTMDAGFPKRAGHESVVFDGRIWVVGGRNGDTLAPLNDVWYSANGVDWTQAASAAPFDPRWDFGLTVYDGKMWVIGGSANDGTPVNDVWYSSDGINWTQATANAGFPARMEPSAVVYGGKMWVTGGFDWAQVFNDVWSSTDGVHWNLETAHADFPARRYQHAEVLDGKLWVIGGTDMTDSISDVWYSADGRNWTQATPAAAFPPRYAFTTAAFLNRLWVIGGTTGNDVWYSGAASGNLPVTITIDPGTSVNSTIASVPDGSTIILNPGTFFEHDIVVTHDITIRANTSAGGSAANTIIDAEFAGRILDDSSNHDLAIDNLSFIHGYATDGGAIYIANSDLNATRPSIITITSSSISNCSAAYDGGAILARSTHPCCMPAPNITILSTAFTSCSAVRGGAIFTNGANVSMRFSRIYGDTDNPVAIWYNTFDAPDNWWGTNDDPSGLVTGMGTMTTSPWLVLDISATPSGIMTGNTSLIQANLTRNSAGDDTSVGGIFVPDGVPVVYGFTGSSGNLLPPVGNITAGWNVTTFEPAEAGPRLFSATVDNQTVYANVTVTAPQALPVPYIWASPASGDAPLDVLFMGDSDGSALSWNWSFGDGAFADERNVSHTYQDPGNYTVNLTIEYPDGVNTTSQEDLVRVTAPEPLPAPYIWASTQDGDAPLVVQFIGSSDGTPLAWNWSFGDGFYADGQNITTHTYQTAGIYTVNLTIEYPTGVNTTSQADMITVTEQPLPAPYIWASTQAGDAPLEVQFVGYSEGTPLNWSWSFGDGEFAEGRNATHMYLTPGIYTVNLTIEYPGGMNTTSQADMITVTAPVIANFTANTTTGKVPLAVRFTDESSGAPTSWAWNFGDGTNSSLQNPEHTYTAAGNYTVALTVTGASGSNTTIRPAYIRAASATKPVAAFTANRTSGKRPLAVKFTDQSTGSPMSWAWSFGDGTTSTLQNPSHTYTRLGVYTVSLTAANDQGSSKKTRSYYIWVTPW